MAITPCLWFERQAEEAAAFYVSIFPNSRIDEILRAGADTPSGSAGGVLVVTFTLNGQRFQALNGGPHDKFNDAISLVIPCADQREVDDYWAALTAGGQAVQCGWLKDRFGVSWQVVPDELPRMLSAPDPAKARRVMEVMLKMVKLDLAQLRAAYAGTA